MVVVVLVGRGGRDTHLRLCYAVSCQLDDGEIALPQSALDVVEAHSDGTPEQRFLDTVSHDHAVLTGTVLWTSRPEPATSKQRWSGGGWEGGTRSHSTRGGVLLGAAT